MAIQTFTSASLGNAPNDASGDGIRTGGGKIVADFTELFSRVVAIEGAAITAANLMRTKLTQAAAGTVDEVISFGSQFVGTYALEIIDFNGIGIEVTAQDQDGFTITSFAAGNFGYIALIEQQ